MNTYYFILFIIAFMMIIDANFSRYLILVYELIELRLQKIYYMIKLHPNNYFELWLVNRRSAKNAEKILSEINNQVRES
jgi:hypothetical protein